MEFELKKWQASYLDDFMKATDDPHLSDNLFENLPYPMDNAFAVEYIRERILNSEERQVCRAIIADGHAIGGVDILIGTGVFSKSAEISIWLAKEYQAKGLGTEVIKKMCSDVFEKYNIIRIDAHPYANHAPAAAALKKAGFVHEGTVHSAIYKHNRTFDYEIFALVRI
ncbi:MAG: GNAT family N-acetyltransferase [Clostridia bacterium]|nr:GNAT family N-acetyltransferase [Clostridia bacterium]